jgi:hypothetical protein
VALPHDVVAAYQIEERKASAPPREKLEEELKVREDEIAEERDAHPDEEAGLEAVAGGWDGFGWHGVSLCRREERITENKEEERAQRRAAGGWSSLQ